MPFKVVLLLRLIIAMATAGCPLRDRVELLAEGGLRLRARVGLLG